jgi:hypothetical protein
MTKKRKLKVWKKNQKPKQGPMRDLVDFLYCEDIFDSELGKVVSESLALHKKLEQEEFEKVQKDAKTVAGVKYVYTELLFERNKEILELANHIKNQIRLAVMDGEKSMKESKDIRHESDPSLHETVYVAYNNLAFMFGIMFTKIRHAGSLKDKIKMLQHLEDTGRRFEK